MRILGIESSCDETAVAIVEDGQKILSNIIVSQIDIFAAYGGVIPEIAAGRKLMLLPSPILPVFLAPFSLAHSPLVPLPSYDINHSMQFTTSNPTSMLTGSKIKLNLIFLLLL